MRSLRRSARRARSARGVTAPGGARTGPTVAPMAARPASAPQVRWADEDSLRRLAHETILREHRWWQRTNPAWIRLMLDARSCSDPHGPTSHRGHRHRLACCEDHVEVDDHLEAVADVLLLFGALDPEVRATTFGSFDRRFEECFAAWLCAEPIDGRRRLPTRMLADLSHAFGTLPGRPDEASSRPSDLGWLDEVAEGLVRREFAFWHDLDDRQVVRMGDLGTASGPLAPEDAILAGHLEAIGPLLLLAPRVDQRTLRSIGCRPSFADHHADLRDEWMRSNAIPFGRSLGRPGLVRLHEHFGATNPYRGFFHESGATDPVDPACAEGCSHGW